MVLAYMEPHPEASEVNRRTPTDFNKLWIRAIVGILAHCLRLPDSGPD